ncbi:beta-1,6-N-acetylglucosaminyltransferase [Wenxinia saemankumensis]|nr:beta-1,6-N-acetylglucosaminyltransferase [Wenxinia saemankumensis]
MLVHTALGRAEQTIRHWVAGGCPVVVHVDRPVDDATFRAFRASLADLPQVSFSPRFRCEWGTWGIVAATQAAAEQMLAAHSQVRHVYLASGSCLPLRPVAELTAWLAARPETDFIESATTADVPWTVGGLSEERFTLRFPFSWKTRRRAFDWYVGFQRRWGLRRRIPPGVVPHMGSQWWCLTRATLEAILRSPDRPAHDRYFRRVWIPDESYFQSLARLHSRRIESRSLTLAKFDFQGKPHIFYDDHLQLLRRSDCFVARKIWPHADRLYDAFLTAETGTPALADPNPGKIDRLFAKAVERRTRGRPGLYMQSRFPNRDWENGLTSSRYSVFEGFAELFDDFESWLARATGTRVHGHLFAPGRVEFEGRQSVFTGALTDDARLRDRDRWMFLTNLLWNTRGERQCFQFGPGDALPRAAAPGGPRGAAQPEAGALRATSTQAEFSWRLARDPNAEIFVISGAWAIPLFRSGGGFAELRRQAARLQSIEADHLGILRSPHAKARVRIWTMADFVDAPMEGLQAVVDEMGHGIWRRLAEVPRMADLDGFGQFLQNLKNQGMHPYLMGDFPAGPAPVRRPPAKRKPYLVR